MAKKRTQINLSQPIQPRGGDLERLFATSGDVEQAAGLQLIAVRLDAIDPDPDQPRSTFHEDALRELADSIRQDGVIQPIEVTQSSPGRYLIVHGERRWRAAQLAGLETIPAVVRRRDYDEVTRFVRQVVENIQREDLNDVDRAAALLRLRKLHPEYDRTIGDRRWHGYRLPPVLRFTLFEEDSPDSSRRGTASVGKARGLYILRKVC